MGIKGEKGNLTMRSGYRTALESLERYMGWEQSLGETFERLEKGQGEASLAKVLGAVAARCRKNKEKIAELLQRIASKDYEVTLKCPLCGWGIPFGNDPETGIERKCLLCSVWFRLTERDGDYLLENLGRKDKK